MNLEMEKSEFCEFYKNTFTGYSQKLQKHIRTRLESQNKITYDSQISCDNIKSKYFEQTAKTEEIISTTSQTEDFMGFYEEIEFIKMYKYSVPLFFDGDIEKALENKNGDFEYLTDKYIPEFKLGTHINDTTPLILKRKNKIFIKFVLQKSYLKPGDIDIINYRYPIIVYFDIQNKILDIRYDSLKYSGENIDSALFYKSIVEKVILWVKDKLKIELFECNHNKCIDIIKDDTSGKVRIYKQMMEMSSGGAAELTASEDMDYVLPFIGEIRELIDENEKVFDASPETKEILLKYLSDKEATAAYPFIYVKWLSPVSINSFVVKITFDYFINKYTLLQHNAGKCNDVGMRRMNDVIKYLCESGAFTKGCEI